jgi:hypothetical protein
MYKWPSLPIRHIIINLASLEFCFISDETVFRGYCESRPKPRESGTVYDGMYSRVMKCEAEGVEVE